MQIQLPVKEIVTLIIKGWIPVAVENLGHSIETVTSERCTELVMDMMRLDLPPDFCQVYEESIVPGKDARKWCIMFFL